ncbi:predicted protein [Naegleria gruberi]|uniref:Predicted protein n=1 Tax=Naegleria gruberi TaxID=5762 RepID=D2VYG8_NAEGR|nr:uncharacterized protein NAEGRDRAFT_59591 [Naegleria gruberi]EFC38056.1 predicted protein [Naegleria gruberi]|eukprot:XP_002670800.1 predicted protein [Naegleria gruberi strain NEG-M]
MISLFIAALFGSNSRNLDKTSNQQLFGYEQQQPVNHHHPPHQQQQPPQQPQQQYYVNNPQPLPPNYQPSIPPPNHRNSIISNNNINNNNNYHLQQQPVNQQPPSSTSNSFKVNNNNYPNVITYPPQQQQANTTNGYPQSQIVDHNQQQQQPFCPPTHHDPNYNAISLERPNLQPIDTDSKPSAPTESFCNGKPSLNETINGNLNFVPTFNEHYQIPPQQESIQFQQNQQTITPPPQQTQPTMQTINMNIAGIPLTLQKPLAQPTGQPNAQPVTMNATVSGGNFNGFGLQPSNNVDITKPFTPISNTQIISTTPGFGQTLCYQQGYNNGIRVNQRVVQTGDQWSTEHEYGTYNVCFRISPKSGEHANNPFSGLVLGVTGIANHKPPAGHTHFIVFNNVQQRIEKRAYPNDCRPAIAGARYMLMESVAIPYNLIASFEVDCVGGRVNKQSLSCVICMLTNGHSIRINQDEMDTVSLSAEKAKWLYQALNYSLAMLKHKQQQQQNNTILSQDNIQNI